MPFFEEEQPAKKTTPSERDKVWAGILFLAIKDEGFRTSKASMKAWANEFRMLRGFVKKKRIKKVLDWYCENINQDYVPHAFSAGGFRKKFIAIEKAMERAIGVQVLVSDEAQRIADRLAIMKWPKGSKAQVPACCELTLTFFKEFKKRLQDYIIEGTFKPKSVNRAAYRFAGHLNETMPSSQHFTEMWLRACLAEVEGWEDWSGDLTKMACKYKAKRFLQIGREWADKFCSDPSRWDKLIGVLNESDGATGGSKGKNDTDRDDSGQAGSRPLIF